MSILFHLQVDIVFPLQQGLQHVEEGLKELALVKESKKKKCRSRFRTSYKTYFINFFYLVGSASGLESELDASDRSAAVASRGHPKPSQARNMLVT